MVNQLDPELWRFGITVFATLIGLLVVCAAIVASVYFKMLQKRLQLKQMSFLKVNRPLGFLQF